MTTPETAMNNFLNRHRFVASFAAVALVIVGISLLSIGGVFHEVQRARYPIYRDYFAQFLPETWLPPKVPRQQPQR